MSNRVFFTNAVLCLKQGGMQVRIPASYFRACGRKFLDPLLDLIRPRAVATLGVGALDGVLHAFGLRRDASLQRLVADQIRFELPHGVRLFPMCHPSRSVLNTTRSLEDQLQDWTVLGRWLRSAGGSGSAPGG